MTAIQPTTDELHLLSEIRRLGLDLHAFVTKEQERLDELEILQATSEYKLVQFLGTFGGWTISNTRYISRVELRVDNFDEELARPTLSLLGFNYINGVLIKTRDHDGSYLYDTMASIDAALHPKLEQYSNDYYESRA